MSRKLRGGVVEDDAINEFLETYDELLPRIFQRIQLIKQLPVSKRPDEVFKAINFLIRNMYFINKQSMLTKAPNVKYSFFKKIHGKEDANLMCAFFKYRDSQENPPQTGQIYNSYKIYIQNLSEQILAIDDLNNLGFLGEAFIRLLIQFVTVKFETFPGQIQADTVINLIRNAKGANSASVRDAYNSNTTMDYTPMEFDKYYNR